VNSPARPRLRLVAFYERSGGVEIEGKAGELRRLSDALLSQVSASFDLAAPEGGNASPYDGFLSSLSITRRDGKALILRRGDALVFEGPPEALDLCSQNIAFLVTDAAQRPWQAGHHIHIEHRGTLPRSGQRTLDPCRWSLTRGSARALGPGSSRLSLREPLAPSFALFRSRPA
jgi:hypothetical protein